MTIATRPVRARRASVPKHGPRVLVVDDSGFARAHLRQLLGRAGARIAAEASTANEALQLFLTVRPDVVTMDMNMPGLNGLDAILALRDLDPRCRVILITAVREDPIVAGLAAMGVPVLHKPVDEAQLARLIR